jgi:hypothetical protein
VSRNKLKIIITLVGVDFDKEPLLFSGEGGVVAVVVVGVVVGVVDETTAGEIVVGVTKGVL